MYKTILDDVTSEYVVKGSKFICHLIYIKDEEYFKLKINELRKQNSSANHICYAYICDNNYKYSDDKEPTNTAGLPIYEVLNKNNLNNVAAIVIRNFGGIKLGSKLASSYTKPVIESIEKCDMVNIIKGVSVDVVCLIKNSDKIEHIIKKYNISNLIKKYGTNVKFSFDTYELDNIKKEIQNYDHSIEVEIVKNIKIKEGTNGQ